jgi:hypothetical protein
MIKQLILPLLGAVAFIILVGLLINSPGTLNIPGVPTPQSALPKAKILIGDKEVEVEIAKSESERELGLGNRTYLAPNSGMLFVFESRGVVLGFWMKGMLIPIDIVWIGDGKVSKIDEHVPVQPSGTPDSQMPSYFPNQPIDYVLEVNSGFSDMYGIEVGDTVDLSNALK